MTKDFDDKIGKFEIAIIEREQYVECLFPFYDGMLFVVFNSKIAVSATSKKIIRSIREFNFEIAKTGVSC